MAIHRVTIPMKLPSINEYINECRKNPYAGAKMKAATEDAIMYCLASLPVLKHPITIKFIWIERNRKRDKDGISFGKKFILDAMQKSGKLDNDNWKWIRGFSDSFELGDDYKVILDIEEVGDVRE